MVSYWENKMNFLQIAGRQRHLARTFELARISDLQVRVTSGNAWADINAFENPFVDDPTVKNKIAGSLAAAEQYYRDEVVRCLVPVYWPSVFLKFPEDVLVYFSVDPQTSSRMRIFQAVWTLAGGAGIAAKLRGLF